MGYGIICNEGSMSDITETLKERGKSYGPFIVQAAIAQTLKRVMREKGWDKLKYDQREALDHIQTKISRILNGDPNHADSWRDIAGYAMLIEKRLAQPEPQPEVD